MRMHPQSMFACKMEKFAVVGPFASYCSARLSHLVAETFTVELLPQFMINGEPLISCEES